CMGQELPSEPDSWRDRVLSLAVVPEGIIRTQNTGGKYTWKVGSHNVPRHAPAWRRVWVSSADVEACVSAQTVSKLAEMLVTQANIQGQRPADSIVILREPRTLPHSEFPLGQAEVIKRGKNIAESGAVVLCATAK